MDYECWPLGDTALILRFGASIDLATNTRVQRAASTLTSASLPGVRAVAPSYAALVITLDLTAVERAGGLDALRQRIHDALTAVSTVAAEPQRLIEIPTRYGGTDGPDLSEVAVSLDMRVADVIEAHASADYRVAMVGFQPGFPYLLGLPERLRLPRRSSVRAQVAAGSVAIANNQAGIYPNESPGGWHLIGRTQLRLFDPGSEHPALLQPGDRVRFVPVL